jgi:hypothetical protein
MEIAGGADGSSYEGIENFHMGRRTSDYIPTFHLTESQAPTALPHT